MRGNEQSKPRKYQKAKFIKCSSFIILCNITDRLHSVYFHRILMFSLTIVPNSISIEKSWTWCGHGIHWRDLTWTCSMCHWRRNVRCRHWRCSPLLSNQISERKKSHLFWRAWEREGEKERRKINHEYVRDWLDDDIVQSKCETEHKSIPSGRVDNWWAGTHADRQRKEHFTVYRIIIIIIEQKKRKKSLDRHVSLHFTIRHSMKNRRQEEFNPWKVDHCYWSFDVFLFCWSNDQHWCNRKITKVIDVFLRLVFAYISLCKLSLLFWFIYSTTVIIIIITISSKQMRMIWLLFTFIDDNLESSCYSPKWNFYVTRKKKKEKNPEFFVLYIIFILEESFDSRFSFFSSSFHCRIYAFLSSTHRRNKKQQPHFTFYSFE